MPRTVARSASHAMRQAARNIWVSVAAVNAILDRGGDKPGWIEGSNPDALAFWASWPVGHKLIPAGILLLKAG